VAVANPGSHKGMLTRLSRLVLAVTLAASIGLHWALLQSIAWAGMIVSYAQTSTLKVALAKTFDGKHPCLLCKQIDQGKRSEKQSDRQIEGKEFEFISDRQNFVFAAPTCFHLLPSFEASAVSRPVRPPVPPPRPVQLYLSWCSLT
jgi:hypothetical protein